MPLKWQEKPLPTLQAGKRHSLFTIAHKFFPTSFLLKAIGISFTSFLFIYRYLLVQGIRTVVSRALLTAAVVAIAPTLILYLFTLARAPRIRKREEREAEHRQHIANGELQALQVKEHKEEQEIVRLESAAADFTKARDVKNRQEDQRWDLLNESLRLQNETVELASEERLLVAQQVKDIKEEGDVIRKGLVSDDLKARRVKDLQEDKRWELLNNTLRAQEETADDRSSAVLHSKELKEEKDAQQREDVAAAVAKLLEARDIKDDERWNALEKHLELQDKKNLQRDEAQRARDEEFRQMWRGDRMH